MQSDWDSLFFTYKPHADQLGDRDERLLRDVGLTRTPSGALALAEDPTYLVDTASPPRRGSGWLRALFTGFARPSKTAISTSACGR